MIWKTVCPLLSGPLYCRAEAHRDKYLASCATAPFYYYLRDVLAPGRRYFFASMLGATKEVVHASHDAVGRASRKDEQHR